MMLVLLMWFRSEVDGDGPRCLLAENYGICLLDFFFLFLCFDRKHNLQ